MLLTEKIVNILDYVVCFFLTRKRVCVTYRENATSGRANAHGAIHTNGSYAQLDGGIGKNQLARFGNGNLDEARGGRKRTARHQHLKREVTCVSEQAAAEGEFS